MPFPEEWKEILKRNLPVYRVLPDSLRKELHGHINVFLDEKHFEGCGELEITDEIRVTIASQACMLLLNRKTKYYPRLVSILVYPSDYVATRVERNGFVKFIKEEVRSGESWNYGTLVLSWDAVIRGALDIHDGRNVVLHEFAHQLDQEDGSADGVPILKQRSRYVAWARVLSKEYERLRKNASKGEVTVLDHYGSSNPAEFFAVLTETFFEKPKELKRSHPDLYKELKDFYKVDTVKWISNK